MNKQTIIHVAVELFLITSITVFLTKRIKSQDQIIHELQHKLEDQGKKIEKLGSTINQLFAIIDELQNDSHQRQNNPQTLRRRRVSNFDEDDIYQTPKQKITPQPYSQRPQQQMQQQQMQQQMHQQQMQQYNQQPQHPQHHQNPMMEMMSLQMGLPMEALLGSIMPGMLGQMSQMDPKVEVVYQTHAPKNQPKVDIQITDEDDPDVDEALNLVLQQQNKEVPEQNQQSVQTEQKS